MESTFEIINHNKFMGYTKNEKGELVIVPEEAEIVRTVFRLYLEGYSAAKISEHLQEKGIRTTTGKEKWHATVVMKMLRNEKYMGDALLQKTYMVDFMTKKKVINNGIVPQYYVEDDHEIKLAYLIQKAETEYLQNRINKGFRHIMCDWKPFSFLCQ